MEKQVIQSVGFRNIEENGEITVFGTFDTYLKNGYTFCILRDAMVY